MSPVATLAGQRWLSPCTGAGDPGFCTSGTSQQTVTISGRPADVFQVTVRIRGVAEVAGYNNGIASAPLGWYAGGTAADTFHNIYRLQISSPAAVYFANYSATDKDVVVALDYTASFAINGGATAVFDVTPQDTTQLQNKDAAGAPITVPGVVTAPSPYDGQFLQLDVIDVK